MPFTFIALQAIHGGIAGWAAPEKRTTIYKCHHPSFKTTPATNLVDKPTGHVHKHLNISLLNLVLHLYSGAV